MPVTYGFYNSLAGDRKYAAGDFNRMFEGVLTQGIFSTVGQALVVSANPGTMTINVGTGRAWLNLTWTYNDSNLVLTVPASESVLNRIDTVVVEVNTDQAVRANAIKIIKGTPASSPVAPTLSNTATLKQYPLADIFVGAAVTQIVAGNITNRIGVAGGTAFITGILTSIDASTLLQQFQGAFETWFTNLQNELDSNQAANLQSQINDLEAGWIDAEEIWTYASADAPTFTFTISGDKTSKYQPGKKIKLTQTTVKYFVITKVEYSAPNTTITIYGGTDYILANAAITSPFWTNEHSPTGFPMDKTKWRVRVVYSSDAIQAPASPGVWYNPGTQGITIPIGSWRIWWDAAVQGVKTTTTATSVGIRATLSTTNNSETDTEMTASLLFPLPASMTNSTGRGMVHRERLLNLSVKTPYFLNINTGGGADSISFVGSAVPTTLVVECAYI